MPFDQADWPALLPGVTLEHVKPHADRPLAGAAVLTRRALEDAGLDQFLAEAAASGRPLTVVVNDPHRFTDTRTFVDDQLAHLSDTTKRKVLHDNVVRVYNLETGS